LSHPTFLRVPYAHILVKSMSRVIELEFYKLNVNRFFLPEGIEFLTAVGTLSYGKTKEVGKLTPAELHVPIPKFCVNFLCLC
jgi:hypothetical protein